MKRIASIWFTLIGLVVLAAFGISGASAQGTVGGSQNLGLVTLNAQNNSGESGSATLSEVNGKLVVTLDLSNGTSVPQPAHIHKGTCANLNPKPQYPLTSVVNGKSETTLDLSLGTLMSEPYAINVHKSAAEVTTYVACGDLTMMARAGGVNPSAGGGTPGMPATGSGDQLVIILALSLLAFGVALTGMRLSRRTR